MYSWLILNKSKDQAGEQSYLAKHICKDRIIINVHKPNLSVEILLGGSHRPQQHLQMILLVRSLFHQNLHNLFKLSGLQFPVVRWVSLQFHCRPTTVDGPQSPVESRLDVIIESQRRPAVPTCYYRNDSSLFAFMFSSRPNQRDNYLCWSWSWTADRRQQTLPARCVFDLRWPLRLCECRRVRVCVCVCAGKGAPLVRPARVRDRNCNWYALDRGHSSHVGPSMSMWMSFALDPAALALISDLLVILG